MQWLIDICKEWVEEWFATYVGYVDRGDVLESDFGAKDLTIDGLWHELNLGGIIPENAKAAHISTRARSIGVEMIIAYRKKGKIQPFGHRALVTQVDQLDIETHVPVALDADRKIEYQITDVIWPFITVRIKGWWF